MKRALGELGVRLGRYRIVGEAPPTHEVCVLVAYPHTSNWDFPLMLSMSWARGLNPKWLGKKELFRGLGGPVMRALGGIEVDRANPTGVVDALVARARSGDALALVVPPEGTRKVKEYWKSGFYRIAMDAGIPIVLTFLDGPSRTGGFGPTLEPTGDLRADMDVIRAFYADKRGVRPHNLTPPRLREEGPPEVEDDGPQDETPDGVERAEVRATGRPGDAP